jgi:hypothetical protein
VAGNAMAPEKRQNIEIKQVNFPAESEGETGKGNPHDLGSYL